MKIFGTAALLGLGSANTFGFFGCPVIPDDKLDTSTMTTVEKTEVNDGDYSIGGIFTNFPASFLGM